MLQQREINGVFIGAPCTLSVVAFWDLFDLLYRLYLKGLEYSSESSRTSNWWLFMQDIDMNEMCGLKPRLYKHWVGVYQGSGGTDFQSSEQRFFFSICKWSNKLGHTFLPLKLLMLLMINSGDGFHQCDVELNCSICCHLGTGILWC